MDLLSGSRCWPMLSAAATNCRPVPSDDIRGVIPLLAKEGSGVVGRLGPREALPPPTVSSGEEGVTAQCVARRLQVSEIPKGKGTQEEYKNRGNELNNSFKTSNLRFFEGENELKTNSNCAQ